MPESMKFLFLIDCLPTLILIKTGFPSGMKDLFALDFGGSTVTYGLPELILSQDWYSLFWEKY
ncbi:hypothetical protein GYH30_040085 [Glycine max]|nr:hypothetical protein GYH30_040085 [Glycine max]